MATNHGHPGENEPRAHGEIHHENRIVDLNEASFQQIASLPMVGPDRAEKLVAARPFRTWDEVEAVEGIGKGKVDDLKSGGAQIGGPDAAKHSIR